MNPSDENKAHKTPSSRTKSNILPAAVIFLLIVTIGGILFYFNSDSEPPAPGLPQAVDTASKDQTLSEETPKATTEVNGRTEQQETETLSVTGGSSISTTNEEPPESLPGEQITGIFNSGALEESEEATAPETVAISSEAPTINKATSCNKPTQQLNDFYRHLDKQPYMADYGLSTSSQKHFTALVKKLLANPPQVARESDDLYTILKNTAHFFRVSGKDNIFMMKGILDHEKGNLEQILADYYELVTTPDCSQTPYASDIDNTALYEYACFFLNTMGGRLYLFRRDSQSRMVVTYYAILLIDRANTQENNRHGIALKPSVDMLIAEMEAGGSTLKGSDLYLDTLYDLKEKYQ
jgi:hypothetical protein